MKKNIKVYIFFILLNIFLLLNVRVSRGDTYDITQYFSIELTDNWTYTLSSMDINYNCNISGVKNINGIDTKIYSYPDPSIQDYYTLDDAGMKLHGGLMSDSLYKYNPPLLILPKNITIGSTYQTSTVVQKPDGTSSNLYLAVTVEGLENITSSSGALLMNTIRVKWSLSASADMTNASVMYYWYYKNIGIVKETRSGLSLYIKNGATYYLSGHKKAELFLDTDGSGNIYYEYLDENYNDRGYGKVSKSQKPDGVWCSYTYFAGTGLIESKTYSSADEFGNIYYQYKNEPFYTDNEGVKYGRLSKQVLSHPDSYGEIGYSYEYYEGSSVIKNKYCYKNADYLNPSNPVLTDFVVRYSYDEMGRLSGIFPGDIKDMYSFTYSWNDPSTGQMTEKWWADYNGDGQTELCRIIIRENGSDYDLTNRDSWNIDFSRIYWQGGLYEYDALERLIRINDDSTGKYRIFEYWGDTDTKKKEVLYSILDMPIETIGYYESGFREYKTYFNTNIQKYETDVYYDATWYLKAKVFTMPDQYGNVYYGYKKENFYPNFGGYPYGRLEKQIRAAPDNDGALAYIYEYSDGSDIVKKKRLFATGNCNDPLNILVDKLILIYDYYASNRIWKKEIIQDKSVDAASEFYNKHTKYYYRDAADYNNGTPSNPADDYGRMDKIINFTDNYYYLFSYSSPESTSVITKNKYMISTGALSEIYTYYDNLSNRPWKKEVLSETSVSPQNEFYGKRVKYYYRDEITSRLDKILNITDNYFYYNFTYSSDDLNRILTKIKYDAMTLQPLIIYTYYDNSVNRIWKKEIIQDKSVDAASEFYNKHTKYYYRDAADYNNGTPSNPADDYGRMDKIINFTDNYYYLFSYSVADPKRVAIRRRYNITTGTLIATYTYNQTSGLLDSIVIAPNETLPLTGTTTVYGNGGVSGGNLTVQSGTLTASSITVGTLTIGSGSKVTIAPILGGPLASGAIQALNQENSAIIGINTAQGQLYNSGSIAVSPQMAGQSNDQTRLLLNSVSGK